MDADADLQRLFELDRERCIEFLEALAHCRRAVQCFPATAGRAAFQAV